MGFSPVVVLYTSVSRVIMFLMWMVVLLSSSTSLSSQHTCLEPIFFLFDTSIEICLSQLKYEIKEFWLKASVFYEQL